MQATILLDELSPRRFDHRAMPREAVTLPILIVVDGKRHNALIRNLSSAGAMIVATAALSRQMKIEFQCGTICADGTVIWQRDDLFGIKFDQPISERQLSEQVFRSDGVSGWRNGRPQASVA